jgi:hypothetical protein
LKIDPESKLHLSHHITSLGSDFELNVEWENCAERMLKNQTAMVDENMYAD